MNVSLSIIIPVALMAGRFSKLRDFFSSVLPGQVELIVVLDEYDEKTTIEIESLILEFSSLRIRYLKGFFGSPGAARNAGLEIASCEWVWFCDSDDEPQIDVLIEELGCVPDNVDVIVFNYSKVNEITGYEFIQQGRLDKTSLAINPGLWRTILRRRIIAATRFRNFALGEDQLFIVQVDLFKRKIKFVPRIVYKYSFGGEGHLVDRRDTTGDLLEVFEITIYLLNLNKWRADEPVNVLVIRQFITLLKVAPYRLKLQALMIMLSHIGSNLSKLPAFIYSTRTILKSREIS